MNFWADKMAERRPQRPAQPQTPASWWQQGQPQKAPAPPPASPGAPARTQAYDYLPPTSERLEAAEERCPRCGSEDYLEVEMDVSYGGRAGLAQTGFNMSKNRRCFSCRYPNFNPSGEVVRGKTLPTKGTKVDRRKVRQAGGGLDGIWGEGSWDNAPLIA